MYAHRSLTEYLNDLSARTPAPGGGSVSALACACAAALLAMVVRFTPANKLTRGDRRFFGQTLKMACASQRRFVRLCDEDCVAFLSRDMRQALAVPKQVAAEAYRLIAVCPRVARAGNSALASDAAIAAALLEAGFAGACWNIGVNLKGKRNAQAILSRYASLRKRVQTCRARTEEEVGRITRR